MAAMVAALRTAKATLSLHIHMAHVGLSAAKEGDLVEKPNCSYVVNSKILENVNQAVEKKLGRGLEMAKAFKGKKADADGMIRLTREEYDSLPKLKFDDGDGDRDNRHVTVRITNNRAHQQALQINHLIGEETWDKLRQNLTIENNEARDLSIQLNAPTTHRVFDKLLEARAQTAAGGTSWGQSAPYGGWQHPPPMPSPDPRMIGPQQQQAVPSWASRPPGVEPGEQATPYGVGQFKQPMPYYALYGQGPQPPYYWVPQGPQGHWEGFMPPKEPPSEAKPMDTTGEMEN